MNNILIGADPELFAVKNGQNVSVHNLLTGSKEDPLKIRSGAVQVDGTAAEFNINPTAKKDIFLRRLKAVRGRIERIIQKTDKRVVLVSTPSVVFSPEVWAKVPEENKELGCNPDFNAYTGVANAKPDPKSIGLERMRTGSGHLHIGWRTPPSTAQTKIEEFAHFEDCCLVVKALDRLILPFEDKWDADKDRRKLYGAKGAFRPKPYGVEYRVLSNAWVDKPEVAGWLFDVCTSVVEYMKRVRGVPYASNTWLVNKGLYPHFLFKKGG